MRLSQLTVRPGQHSAASKGSLVRGGRRGAVQQHHQLWICIKLEMRLTRITKVTCAYIHAKYTMVTKNPN
jgi:hypothetical protein